MFVARRKCHGLLFFRFPIIAKAVVLAPMTNIIADSAK